MLAALGDKKRQASMTIMGLVLAACEGQNALAEQIQQLLVSRGQEGHGALLRVGARAEGWPRRAGADR